ALNLLSNIDAGDVSAADADGGLGASSGSVILTWGGKFRDRDFAVSIATGSLTGNAHVLTETVAGVTADGTNDIVGFLWPDELTLASGAETLAQILTEGQL